MMEDELIKIWQSSPNQERIKFEKSRLMIDVQSSLDRFHKLVKYRDLSEIIPAMVMIPLFAYQVYAIPFPLSKIASVLIVFWIVYVIYRLKRAKKYKPDSFTETYIDYLYQSRRYIQVQKRLSDTVLYWYILPGLSAVVLFVMGAYFGGRADNRTLALMVFSIIAIGVGVYLWNKWGVKKQISPRLAKIDKLIEAMEE